MKSGYKKSVTKSGIPYEIWHEDGGVVIKRTLEKNTGITMEMKIPDSVSDEEKKCAIELFAYSKNKESEQEKIIKLLNNY